jgi:prolyl oligopeptidase
VAAADAADRSPVDADTDPYRWLEEITGAEALRWVTERNSSVIGALTRTPLFAELRDEILEVLDADTRIPYVVRRGEHLYNFWQDGHHPRGLWRRTTLTEYRRDEPAWDIVLDLDALAEAEGESWVWAGVGFLEPDYRRCLLSLSRGGADAIVVREFDVSTRSFVDGGFTLAEAKSTCDWIDADTLYVATDFGPGSMTDSGYPRIAKRWRRGTPLAEATLVYEGLPADLSVSAWHDPTPGYERDFVSRGTDFYHGELYLLTGAELTKVDVPDDASASVYRDWMLVETRSPWTVGAATYPAGALLAARFDDFLAGDRTLTVLVTPDEHSALISYDWTRHHLIVGTLVDVRSTLEVLTPTDGGWKCAPLADVPAWCSVSVVDTDPDHSDEYWLAIDGFLAPPTLQRGVLGATPLETIKSSPAFFDTAGVEVAQHFTTSADGTAIPYFVVGQPGSGGPTLLAGYGGFEVSRLPGYDSADGRAWLARGGVLAIANIRGGGEYGPRWHQAALKANRPLAYADFAAVAQDLVARGITCPDQLAIRGGSNGGLLMGNMLTTYPELFGAVVAQVPLLDMRRYHRLLAGASWMAEYGDPDDPQEWAFIRGFSPYHNVTAGKPYPPTLFTTSTRDDRVHPGHARKMVARMEELGYDVSYFENVEGGHGGAANNEQTAFVEALVFSFLWSRLAPAAGGG